MRWDILSLFPDYFQGPFDESIIKRARERGLIDINLVNIRDFATDRHRRVDDRPYGGGPGMVMMPEPTCQAIRSVKREGTRVVHLSPQGALLNATTCRRLAAYEHLVLLCGHYEGVDQRIIDSEVDEEISIGDYVLSNGCAAAIIVVDAVSRFVPGVVGNEEAVGSDSFEQGIFDHPHYTRPEEFENRRVPTVLMSGNHREIDRWRHRAAWEKTQKIRPELTKGTVQ